MLLKCALYEHTCPSLHSCLLCDVTPHFMHLTESQQVFTAEVFIVWYVKGKQSHTNILPGQDRTLVGVKLQTVTLETFLPCVPEVLLGSRTSTYHSVLWSILETFFLLSISHTCIHTTTVISVEIQIIQISSWTLRWCLHRALHSPSWTVACLTSMVGSYSSTKWFWMSWMVRALLPTPPAPTTTSLYSVMPGESQVYLVISQYEGKERASVASCPPSASSSPHWHGEEPDPDLRLLSELQSADLDVTPSRPFLNLAGAQHVWQKQSEWFTRCLRAYLCVVNLRNDSRMSELINEISLLHNVSLGRFPHSKQANFIICQQLRNYSTTFWSCRYKTARHVQYICIK